MSNTLVVDTTLQATQQASDFSVLGFKSILPTSTNTPEELTIDTFRDGVRPLLLSNPLVDLFAPGNAEKFLTSGTLTTDRATVGTFIDKNDGLLKTAAIDTIREEAEGFLIEGASTNLALHSEDFGNAIWGKLGANPPSVIIDQTIAPDGNMTADNLVFINPTVASRLSQAHTFTGGPHTDSVFVKNKTGSNIIRLVFFDGTVETFSGNINVTDDWIRVDFSLVLSAGIGRFDIRAGTALADVDIYVWGAQLE